MATASSEPPDKGRKKKNNKDQPVLDEYDVLNSKDELDYDNQSIQDEKEEEETCEDLIRAFIPLQEQSIDNEVQKEATKPGLSPRRLSIKIPKKDPPFVTASSPLLAYPPQDHPNDEYNYIE